MEIIGLMYLVSFIFKNLTIKTLKELNWGYFEHHYQFMKSTDLKVIANEDGQD